nr:RNA-directed DNA polymerase, eukaryota [Tanacetum cinerariifolium]
KGHTCWEKVCRLEGKTGLKEMDNAVGALDISFGSGSCPEPRWVTWVWTLDSVGDFSAKSVRTLIDDTFLPSVGNETRWINVVPIKINVFAWKVCLDKLPTRFNLSFRGLDIPSILCPVCHSAGVSSSHLFFSCNVARLLQSKVARWWDLVVLDIHSYDDWLSWFYSLRLIKRLKDVLEGLFYVMWWVICNFRNLVLFGKSQPCLELLFDEIVYCLSLGVRVAIKVNLIGTLG